LGQNLHFINQGSAKKILDQFNAKSSRKFHNSIDGVLDLGAGACVDRFERDVIYELRFFRI
jgi:hypothetical protein